MRFLKDNILVIAISMIIIVLLFVILKDLVLSGLVAATVAIVSYPLFRKINHRINNHSISAFLFTCMIAIAFFLIILLPIYMIYSNREDVMNYVRYGENLLSDLPVNSSEIKYEATDEAKKYGIQLFRNLDRMLFNTILFFIILFLILKHSDSIKDETNRLLSQYPKTNSLVKHLYRNLYNTLHMIYVSNIIIAVAVFILSIPLFWFLGYDKVLFLAILAGFFELLPILGPMIIVAGIALHQYLIGNIVGLTVSLVYGIIVIGILPDYILRSFIIGKKSETSELLVLISIIGGILTIGGWGIIFGPVILVLAKTIFEYVSSDSKTLRIWKR